MAPAGLFAVRRTGGGTLCPLCPGRCGGGRNTAGGPGGCAGCGRGRICIYGFSVGAAVRGGGHPYFCRQHGALRHGGVQKAVFQTGLHGGILSAGAEHLFAGTQRLELAFGPVRRGGSGRGCVAAGAEAGELGISVRPGSGAAAGIGLRLFPGAGGADGPAAGGGTGVQRVPVCGPGGLPGPIG